MPYKFIGFGRVGYIYIYKYATLVDLTTID